MILPLMILPPHDFATGLCLARGLPPFDDFPLLWFVTSDSGRATHLKLKVQHYWAHPGRKPGEAARDYGFARLAPRCLPSTRRLTSFWELVSSHGHRRAGELDMTVRIVYCAV